MKLQTLYETIKIHCIVDGESHAMKPKANASSNKKRAAELRVVCAI